ncbi:MAG: TetM/TetW/TetO/TetS family tetracycline resistance ribosomal protection protein [Lachnospiraceae bacterium]|nr:TetM/TetW/TetO/TetS family tetracycline resistance ribosomal protection protein [Lachnospiraceae bacterium]
MGVKAEKNPTKHICAALLAHVDAGKTTLSEGILYTAGAIRKIGRVDKKDAFLDHEELERTRGITIFSKEARAQYENIQLTLLDTPGHVDFSTEMERTLQVLDYAVLVISGSDGVQGHTVTLWNLLERYRIPVFLFVNKMDQPGTEKEALLQELKTRLSEGCIDFSKTDTEEFYENAAMTKESLLEEFIEEGSIEREHIKDAIKKRDIFPCLFGSALKLEGVETLLKKMDSFCMEREYPKEFGARIYKISRDDSGNRLTHMKITGGSLKVKTTLLGKNWEEKVDQIRLYSGEKYETATEVCAGTVCAVTGLHSTRAGEGIGIEKGETQPVLEPVLTYRILLSEGTDPAMVLPKLQELMEEEPELHITWEEELEEIHVQVMGEIQIEILKELIAERFGLNVTFDQGSIVYKETIANKVEGVGHYEPLRHYAEVHLLMEPGEEGSGLVFSSSLSEDSLDRNWQRLILTHLMEKEHRGVLTGSAITDMKITLAAGKAHLKHTEGGDFRQATYRAVRQGLMEAKSILLEPYYEFRMELPESCVGRAMTDMERMNGSISMDYDKMEDGLKTDSFALLTGSVPVASMRGYQREFSSYTKGEGRLTCVVKGYGPCHNAKEVEEQFQYDPQADTKNPSGSVFCSHGAGYYVPWDEVKDKMHLPSALEKEMKEEETPQFVSHYEEERFIDEDEIESIFNQTFYANRQKDAGERRRYHKSNRKDGGITTTYYSTEDRMRQAAKPKIKRKEYLLVDGYNIVFAWEELRELANVNIDSARDKLLDIMCDYQGIRQCELIVVFDAYRVKGHDRELLDFHNIHVVYTKEAETADSYIEKFAHENGKKYDVTVATSDGLEQMIIVGQGCRLFSAREFLEEVTRARQKLWEDYPVLKEEKHTIEKAVSEETMKEMYHKAEDEKE